MKWAFQTAKSTLDVASFKVSQMMKQHNPALQEMGV